MLSVLIPTYNTATDQLVHSLLEQMESCEVEFEIRVYDDGSTTPTLGAEFQHHPKVIHERMAKNLGRSAIRNRLAADALFDNLLFLDADVAPNPELIKNYLPYCTTKAEVVTGGITYPKSYPSPQQSLRYYYGKQREARSLETRKEHPYLSFLSLNFLIHRSVFQQVTFNEELPNLRHEDTLFGQDLKKAGIPIQHLDNTVVHLGLETNADFLRKSEEAIEGLQFMIERQMISAKVVRLSRLATQLHQIGVSGLVRKIYQSLRFRLVNNLLSAEPSLKVFDFYRLGYWFSLQNEKHA
ncbi:glycosyltransferase family 2 protein [Croceiramulus getboli]|nr:glycosyltransferase [Flavobacteriaceae bacterium YJPT1-3]